MSSIVRIFLDTETTGLSTLKGDSYGAHRIVEIGCVKTVNGVVVDKFHAYLNPEREVPEGSKEIHGLSWSFLRQYPTFCKIYKNFLNFIGQQVLVIHNARFDTTFLNWELAQVSQQELSNPVEDTLVLARKKFPGSPASLDALCRRFRISLAERTYHGALLDAELLCSVYQELCKEQNVFEFRDLIETQEGSLERYASLGTRQERQFSISSQEVLMHEEAMDRLKR
ncbi:DNA polymerase III subunit epsilon [Holospora curviuscula]|uniref:DNA polymerase III subunit epsilon n=1 Tax=Holospora curviuscula TaxID=1082868 RepID=A0A2S5R8A7_9PROT|nr:DNA polymerase III subunit epsilon [Holospora curviuscula]PPE03564.1 DNA polymerase III subunit epsilon [Holospora curviuscula]